MSAFVSVLLQNDYMRMEKADILENVVKYMQSQQQTGRAGAGCAAKATCDAQYRIGYLHCVREVTGVLEHLCGANSQVTQSLTHYLNIKVTQLTNQYLSQGGRQSPTATSASSKSENLPPHTSRVHPECTSASGVIPPEQRVPPIYPSLHSAFHKVQGSSPGTPTSATDNISIAVYQYNHYNNYRNTKARASQGPDSNMNIRPVIKVETQASAGGDVTSRTVRPSDINRNLHRQLDDELLKGDDMWRPW